MELPDLDVRAARFVDGLGEQLLDVAEAFFAQQLEVAAGHELPLPGTVSMKPCASSSA